MTTDRLIRADAARNRERILDTARSRITVHGPDVSMVDIAAAAGVAVGTLYRHFPTKTDLVAAIVSEHLDKLAGLVEKSVIRVESGLAEADDELLHLLLTVLDGAADNRALRAAALTLPEQPAYSQSVLRAFSALNQLVAAGRAAGRLRPDLTADDVVLLACTGPFDQPAQARERWLDLVRPGLLAQPAHSAPAQKA